jgi:hypothetical protein
MTKETRDNIRDLVERHGFSNMKCLLEPEKAPSIFSKKVLEDGFQLGSYDECVALLGLEMARAWWVA